MAARIAQCRAEAAEPYAGNPLVYHKNFQPFGPGNNFDYYQGIDTELSKAAEEGPDPDAYRAEHGKCPKGYRYNEEEAQCAPIDVKDVSDKEGAVPGEKPEAPTQTRPKRRYLSEERHRELDELAKKDWASYESEVDRLRQEGVLPDRETAKLLVQIEKVDDLPDDIRKDPGKLREVLEQQEAQRRHEENTLSKTVAYLEQFAKEKKRAELRGEKPPRLNTLKMLTDVEELYGRNLGFDKEMTAKEIDASQDLFAKSLVGPKPNTRAWKIRKWFERLLKPLPVWTPGKVRGSTGGTMKKTMKTILDDVAEALEQRRARALAALVDAEASGFPEADKLPDAARTPAGQADWKLQTSDFDEDLGFPPYDKKRPKVVF